MRCPADRLGGGFVRALHSAGTSRSQYRLALAEWIGRFPWTHFVTLTWDPSRQRHPSTLLRRMPRATHVGMCVLAKKCAGRDWWKCTPPVIQYFGVVEKNRAGEPHFHLAVILRAPLADANNRAFQAWWRRRHGLCHVRPVPDIPHLASYLAKAAGPTEEFLISQDLRLPTSLV